MERKGNSTLYSWLTKKYQLIIRNEADFSEKTTISYNDGKAFMFLFFVFTISAVSGYFTINYVDSLFSRKDDTKKLGKDLVEMSHEIDELNKLIRMYQANDEEIRKLMKVMPVEKTDSVKYLR